MRPEHTHTIRNSELSKTKASIALLLTAVFFSLASPVHAEPPQSCFRSDGHIDLNLCKGKIFQVPNDVLDEGYYNNFGEFEPHLPSVELRQFDAGTMIEGNILRMNNALTWADVTQTAEEMGIDVNQLKGGMATDSTRYLNSFAWVRRKGSGAEFYGPLLVSSNAAPVHLRQRACHYGSVGEINSDAYYAIGGDGGTLEVEVVFTDTSTFTAPSASSGGFADYSAAFLDAANYACP